MLFFTMSQFQQSDGYKRNTVHTFALSDVTLSEWMRWSKTTEARATHWVCGFNYCIIVNVLKADCQV